MWVAYVKEDGDGVVSADGISRSLVVRLKSCTVRGKARQGVHASASSCLERRKSTALTHTDRNLPLSLSLYDVEVSAKARAVEDTRGSDREREARIEGTPPETPHPPATER